MFIISYERVLGNRITSHLQMNMMILLYFMKP